jgi:hypothetical protein
MKMFASSLVSGMFDCKQRESELINSHDTISRIDLAQHQATALKKLSSACLGLTTKKGT